MCFSRGVRASRQEAAYDLAFAIRVGAFDGRHPRAGEQARRRIRAALVPGGKLLIDGGSPLRESSLTAASRVVLVVARSRAQL